MRTPMGTPPMDGCSSGNFRKYIILNTTILLNRLKFQLVITVGLLMDW